MPNNDFLKELSERLSRIMPAAEELRVETRTKIEQALKNGLADLNVLTQEEFEVHTRALERAEQRITELENVVKKLEAKLEQEDAED